MDVIRHHLARYSSTVLFLVVIGTAAMTPALVAQNGTPVPAGARVRYSLAPGIPEIGTLVSYDERAFVIDVNGTLGTVHWDAVRSIEASLGTRSNGKAGFGAGAVVGALVAAGGLKGSSCTGSGAYLTLCRAIFLGAAVGGGVMGGLIGRVKSDVWAPLEHNSGRAAGLTTSPLASESLGRDRLTGATLGAFWGVVGAFFISAIACEQEDHDNPGILCSYSGMIGIGPLAVAAVAGGAVGAFFGTGYGRIEVHPTPGGAGPVPALAVGLRLPMGH